MKHLIPVSFMIFGLGTLCGQAAAPAAAEVPRFAGKTPVEWSRGLAHSERARYGATLEFEGAPRARWDYTTALLSQALLDMAANDGDDALRDYGARMVTTFVAPDGAIRTYRMSDYNIDMIPPGKVLLREYQRIGEARFLTAAHTMREQLAQHPRTSEGGFWHKQRYPYQMWLDGLFMAAPFYAHYGVMFDRPADVDDAMFQLQLVDRHTWVPDKQLHVHAWDEARAQPWADPVTGRAPNVWGRAVGWYAMALVDTLDFTPGIHHDVEAVNEIIKRLAEGLVRHQDPATGVWWQVMDMPEREGNYREATATSMFVYFLAKAVNRGYLPHDVYEPVVRRAYAGLIKEFVRLDANGLVDLTRCCQVAGLGYTNSAGRVRDGTFEYYISEPIINNDPKGTGPFIMAGLEVEKLLTSTPADRPLLVTGWNALPALLARIQAPTFAARDFPITDFGAQPGPAVSVTAAIRAAIQACHDAGGGRVVVPAGEWHTGAIHLLSNVNLHVAEGAVLKFSVDPADYPIVFTRWEGMELMNYSPLIYAYEQENIAISGKGTLDGQASWETWWAWNNKAAGQPTKQVPARKRLYELAEAGVPVAERVFGDGHFLRPNFIQPYKCRNIIIEDVKIIASPMWEIHPVLSQNITVRRVEVISNGTNNDGCNPESSRDVLIEDSIFDTGDDCIAIKSGRNNDGRRINVPSENIIIRRCVMRDGHGGVVIGSEISGGARNIFIEDCEMSSPDLDRALRFKTNASRGGVIENIFMRNVRIGQVAEAVVTIDLQYEEGAQGDFPPTVRRVRLENITSANSPRVLFIAGFEGATIEDIEIKNSTFAGLTHPDRIEHAGRIGFENVTFEAKTRARALNSVAAP